MEGRAKRAADLVAALVLALLAGVELDTARRLSVTVDEPGTIAMAYRDLAHGEGAASLGRPPLVHDLIARTLAGLGVREGEAASLPADFIFTYGDRLIFDENPGFALPRTAPGPESVVLAARLPLLVFPLLLALTAYLWAREREGALAGLVALLLVATDPDLLGHGALAGTDVPFAAFALASGYALDRLVRRGGAASLILLGVSLGGALATKITAPVLLPALALAALAGRPRDPAPASLAHPFGEGPARGRKLAIAALAVAVLVLAVLWLAYGSNPLAAYWTRSGHVSQGPRPGPWDYFLVASARKTPLGTLALLATAVLLAVRAPDGRATLRSSATLLLPALALFAAASVLAPPIGTRFVLPAIPFLLVFAGRVGRWASPSRLRRALVALALGANVAGAALEHPFHANATNLLAGRPELAWRELDDSNVDWGGGLLALAAWQRATGTGRLVVVPFDPDPFPRGEPVPSPGAPPAYHAMTHLEAYGVAGEVRNGAALFEPVPGRVYAVSGHVLARAHARDEEKLRSLGEPSAVVGGFVIFTPR
jgi:hypothetical protein